jgi:hypothetical protein
LQGGGGARQRPLDTLDRCDFKTIQKTCSLFGLDLVSRLSYTSWNSSAAG